VGFNHELTARENVVLNGVMIGLTPREMRRRFDSVIDFAELHDFADLKLKNYSSGMLVRLGFSLMMEADPDVLLIDEVLAVGDASFQQKCADAFHEMKADGKTIVLVTHEMAAVESYCHRAMLLRDGRVQHLGAPTETGNEYLKLNFAGTESEARMEATVDGDGARLLSCRLESASGEETGTVEVGEPIRLRAEIELRRKPPGLHVGMVIANADDISLFEVGVPVTSEDGYDIKGDRVVVTATVENPLAPGRHFIHVGIQSPFGISVYVAKAASFVVYGTHHGKGIIAPHYESDAVITDDSSL
jgi:ABC-2 type transport system ATP-binding protein